MHILMDKLTELIGVKILLQILKDLTEKELLNPGDFIKSHFRRNFIGKFLLISD